jgi:hypothetical protein
VRNNYECALINVVNLKELEGGQCEDIDLRLVAESQVPGFNSSVPTDLRSNDEQHPSPCLILYNVVICISGTILFANPLLTFVTNLVLNRGLTTPSYRRILPMIQSANNIKRRGPVPSVGNKSEVQKQQRQKSLLSTIWAVWVISQLLLQIRSRSVACAVDLDGSSVMGNRVCPLSKRSQTIREKGDDTAAVVEEETGPLLAQSPSFRFRITAAMTASNAIIAPLSWTGTSLFQTMVISR